MLHRIRSWLGVWWHDQRGSQGTQAAGTAIVAAAIVGALLLGAQDYLAPAVERALRCAAAVLEGGGMSCDSEADEAAPPTPDALAQQYLASVRALLDRSVRGDLSHVDLQAALRALPPLTPEAEAALWALLEQRYHADDGRVLTDTDLYRQYQHYPATTTLGHVVIGALAFERYVHDPLRYDGQSLHTHAQVWAEYAHNRALGDAVSDVYVTQLDHLDAHAQQRPLTDAEVLARQDLLLRLNGPMDTDSVGPGPILSGGLAGGAVLGGAAAGPLRAADDAGGGSTNSGHLPAPQRTLFENKFPEHEVAHPRQVFTPQQIRQPYFNNRLNYVVKADGTLVLGRRQDTPGGGHIDLAQGAPVLAAGEVRVVKGKIIYVDNSSGHYLPDGPNAQAEAEAAFRRAGFDTISYVEKVWNGSAWVPK